MLLHSAKLRDLLVSKANIHPKNVLVLPHVSTFLCSRLLDSLNVLLRRFNYTTARASCQLYPTNCFSCATCFVVELSLMDTFVNWFNQEIKKRGWAYADVARRGGISRSTISKIISGQSQPGPDFCKAVSRAFGIRDEFVFRKAGLLEPVPPAVEEEKEAVCLLRSFSQQARDTAMTILRALSHPGRGAQTTSEGVTDYDVPRTLSERLAYQLARELEQMPPEDQQRVLDFMKRLQERRRGDGAATRVPMDADP